MDTTPPPRKSEPRRSKSTSRHAQFFHESAENLLHNLTTSPKKSPTPLDLTPQLRSKPSTSSPNSLPIRELLLLSHSPRRKSKHGLNQSPYKIEKNPSISIPEKTSIIIEDAVEAQICRRKYRSRGSSMNLLCCSSPRNTGRVRRRLEQEGREERDLGFAEENGMARKRRHSRAATRREKRSSILLLPPPDSSPRKQSSEIGNGDESSLNCVRQQIFNLIMWNDVSKSSLWFGFGSLCFLSSSFSRGINFSFITAISHLGLLILAMASFYNSFRQREKENPTQNFKMREENLVRAVRIIIPVANEAITKVKELFSGEPAMTLKMAPILLFGSNYGHLITLWRLAAFGFFISFTVPKLYSCYSLQINRKVEFFRGWVWKTWVACSHKRIVAASAATVFWNVFSVKTRIFAAFIIVVLFRYYRHYSGTEEKGGEPQELVVAEDKGLVNKNIQQGGTSP